MLIVLLVVALLAMLLAGFIASSFGRAQLREAYGAQLVETAERTTAPVGSVVFRRTLDASMYARVPALWQAAASGGPTPFDRAATLVKRPIVRRVVEEQA